MVWARSRSASTAIMAVILVSVLVGVASSQGLPQSPYSAPSVVRGGGLDLAPSNPLGLPSAIGPRSSDSILLTPQLFQGIVPQIPNLQVGYLYSFGKTVKSGRLTTDFLLPISLSRDSTAFGEAHGEFQDFWKTVQGEANNRVDLSFGGGVRTIRGDNTLLGVNGFFDTTRLGGQWYSSGSVGFEMAALLPGNDALDLNFNWYGNLFNSNVLANAFRRGPSNFDFEAGYSRELYNGGPDLRLNVTGYKFSAGTGVYGVRGGAELKTRDGMFSVKYEAGDDRVNGTYHTVGGFVNVGLQLENLLSGQSPFAAPEPIFQSPRNLTAMLTRKVKRSFFQPVSMIVSRAGRVTRMCLNGPEVWAHSGIRFQGAVPDLSGFTTVRILWDGVVPDPARKEVTFEMFDGVSWYFEGGKGGIDMTEAEGAVVLALEWRHTDGRNRIRYHEDDSHAALVLSASGYVCFEFY